MEEECKTLKTIKKKKPNELWWNFDLWAIILY